MKSTDILQPVAMATPIAVSGSKDEIPQEQANVQLPWYCSIEQGFPDITMTALNQGGRPPRGQGMNGLLNLISDQKVYLQNGGILTFNQSVSDTIGGYPQGAILDYVQNNTYAKVKSLVDDNTVDFTVNGVDGTNWQLLDFGGGDVGDNADTDLSNLSTEGNAKFQYAPFSINNGTVDDNGYNVTLQTIGDVPVEVETYVVPVLTSNNSDYGVCNDYTMTEIKSGGYTNYANPWTMELSENNHIPAGAEVTFTISTLNAYYNYQSGWHYRARGCTGCKITYTYTDNTTEVILDENKTGNFASWIGNSKDHSATITLSAASKEIKEISLTGYADFGQDYNFYNAWGITFYAKYTASSADTLICNPCTVTTADSRTKTFKYDNVLDCSSAADGTYKIIKSYQDGSLSLVDNITISKTVPNETLWTQPILSANGTLGGDSFAVAASSEYNTNSQAWYAVNGTTSSIDNYYWLSNSMPCWFTFYNPEPLRVTNLNIVNREDNASFVIATGEVQGSNDDSTWTTLKTISNSVTGAGANWNIDLSDNNSYYTYYRIYITSRTGGSPNYAAINELTITAYTGSLLNNGDLWLETSSYPLTIKEYDSANNTWTVNNDLVYIGDVTVGNGVITAINNNYFNACPAYRELVDSYKNGSSYYEIYSDGWCEQGGRAHVSSGATITLLKAYADINYNIELTPYRGDANTAITAWVGTVTPGLAAFSYGATSSSTAGVYWKTSGYIG